MKNSSLAVLVSLSMLAGLAYAQEDHGIAVGTDKAKIAEIEGQANALQEKGEKQSQSAKSTIQKRMADIHSKMRVHTRSAAHSVRAHREQHEHE